MNLLEVMKALYDSEINCGMECFWDNGFDVWLGDHRFGYLAQRNFYPDCFDDAAAWLATEARRRYPHSEFAQGAYHV
jgi:hypothetical protein